MFSTPAYASTAGAAAGGGIEQILLQILPLVALMVLFYFLLIRPQQTRMKKHQAMIGAVKRGDQVVLSNGMIGKITRVEPEEVQVEVAPNTNVRVVKTMIGEVRAKPVPLPANDSKS
jgi:preprotein translocase subunit YajC